MKIHWQPAIFIDNSAQREKIFGRILDPDFKEGKTFKEALPSLNSRILSKYMEVHGEVNDEGELTYDENAKQDLDNDERQFYRIKRLQIPVGNLTHPQVQGYLKFLKSKECDPDIFRSREQQNIIDYYYDHNLKYIIAF